LMKDFSEVALPKFASVRLLSRHVRRAVTWAVRRPIWSSHPFSPVGQTVRAFETSIRPLDPRQQGREGNFLEIPDGGPSILKPGLRFSEFPHLGMPELEPESDFCRSRPVSHGQIADSL
jgi:hypothetical protein